MAVKISAVVSAFNEEKNIAECLKSLSWTDEIILVNNSSTDKTVAIARKYTSKIFNRPNHQMLNLNKNYGFTKASGDWVLNLDADERVNDKLREEIKFKLQEESLMINGYEIPRKNILFHRWIQHGIWWPDYQLRLFKKGKGKFPCQHVHEKLKVDGQINQLENPLIHYNYNSVGQFVRKMNDIYTEDEAENFLKAGKKIYWYDALSMPVNDFLANFFSRESYKDGLHGLVLSLLQAFYSLLVFAKIWEKQKFWEYNSPHFLDEIKTEVDKSHKDLEFWLKRTRVKGWLKRLLRS